MKERHSKMKFEKVVKMIVMILSCFMIEGVVTSATELPQQEASVEEQMLQSGFVNSKYTNEWIDAQSSEQRPIAVLMGTESAALPNYGIGNAKILYEITDTGEISRQLAIIDDWQNIPQIGNVRSVKAFYIPLVTEWDSILIHNGGEASMKARITASDISNISGTYEYGVGGIKPGYNYFFRVPDKKTPHNIFISGDGILQACKKLAYSTTERKQYNSLTHFQFASATNTLEQYESAANANLVDVSNIFPSSQTSFMYNSADGLYYKTIHGSPHIDGQNGQQIAFSNIIIQNMKSTKTGTKGNLAYQNLDTTMDGYYVTKGKAIHINWQKTDEYAPTKYYDDYGNEILLNTGKTYIGIAQSGRKVVFK